MTDKDLASLPPEFLLAIARSAFGYVNARGKAAGPGWYRALRSDVSFAQAWLHMDADEAVAEPVQMDEISNRKRAA